MGRLKLDQDALGLAILLERRAGVEVRDCFKDQETVYFIVAPGQIGKALGKGGRTIKNVQQEIGKKVKVIEYHELVEAFLKNIIYPLTVQEIIREEKVVFLKDADKKTKSLLIGRDGRNLQLINRAVKRFFDVEIKII